MALDSLVLAASFRSRDARLPGSQPRNIERRVRAILATARCRRPYCKGSRFRRRGAPDNCGPQHAGKIAIARRLDHLTSGCRIPLGTSADVSEVAEGVDLTRLRPGK